MAEPQLSAAERTTRQPGPRKIVLEIGPSRALTIVGAEPTVEGLIDILEEALSKARKARQMKLGLKTFLSMLKDQQAT